MSSYGSNASDWISVIMASSFFIIYLIFILVFFAIAIALTVFVIICNWKLMEKAGEPGWKSIIPFYNIYTIMNFSLTRPTSTVFFIVFCVMYVTLCIPYLGAFIFSIVVGAILGITSYATAKAFGRDVGMCVCAIFFGPIIKAILAFSKNIQYTGDKFTIFASSNQQNQRDGSSGSFRTRGTVLKHQKNFRENGSFFM